MRATAGPSGDQFWTGWTGETVVTASIRLARSLRESYPAAQKVAGRELWVIPEILPAGAYVEKVWREQLYAGRIDPGIYSLSAAQEVLVWEKAIAYCEPESLLRMRPSAQAAMEAWALVHEYRLPWESGEFLASPDGEAFARWAARFRQMCRENGWIEAARLPSLLAACHRGAGVTLAGFEELTPQQAAFYGEATLHDPPCAGESVAHGWVLRDTAEEMEHCALRVRQWMEQGPNEAIGVVALHLNEERSRIERTFREVLGAQAFHISLGEPLSSQPVVSTALALLRAGFEAVSIDEAGVLLRSAYLGWGERGQRALLEAGWRRRGKWRIAPAELGSALQCSKDWNARLQGTHKASAWAARFSSVLNVAGWPGSGLDSLEHQSVEAWQRVLENFEDLDRVQDSCSFSQAWEMLRGLAESTLHQTEDIGAPVQILGALEASGLRFRRLCVLGAHDRVLPGPARLNPFLPAALQRAYRLPHSSAARESEYAAALVQRLLRQAPEVHFSYARAKGDEKFGPAPVLTIPFQEPVQQMREGPLQECWNSRKIEAEEDNTGTPLPPGTLVRGGTGVIRDVAACPFRAFALRRLRVQDLGDPQPWPEVRQRGGNLHKSLEEFWREVQSQANLLAMSEAETLAAVERAVEKALDRERSQFGDRALEVERARLIRTIQEWLIQERNKAPFRVKELEFERQVEICDLKFSLKVDRIDEMAGTGIVMLDYKSGDVSEKKWAGERPGEPQLLVYAVTHSEPVAEIQFAKLKPGDMKTVRAAADLSRWREVVESLTAEFRNGVAVVHPKEGLKTCSLCNLQPLCRIDSAAAQVDEDD